MAKKMQLGLIKMSNLLKQIERTVRFFKPAQVSNE